MRFLKIFLVSFFSLIGVVALIVGGMYLFGGLTPKKVNPQNIYFEYDEGQTEFCFASDSYITINTETNDVNVKDITLSFASGDYNDNEVDKNGYISNGIIKVPQKVTLGQKFKVELVTESNPELDDEEWIVGGQSVLQASSESLQASNIQTTINVDVPIKNITVKTYADSEFLEEKTSFAEGETFYAKAEFLPSTSMYKYCKESLGTKTVYFETYDNISNTIELNSDMTKDFVDNGKNNVAVYNALKTSSNTSITGYAFLNTKLEEETIKNNVDPLSVLQNPNNVSVASQPQEVSFVTVTVNKLSITPSNTQKILSYNEINKIYANYGNATGALNFGIKISGKDNQNNTQSLQSKISNIGLSVYIKTVEGGFIATTASEDTFLFVDKANNIIQPDENGQYFSISVNSDVNKNYWNFVPLIENVEYAFVLTLKDETTTFSVSTYSSESQQIWKSSNIISSSIAWKNDTPINLLVIDSTDTEKISSQEYNLDDNLNFHSGTFYTVKYIAYTEANAADLTTVISQCVKPSTKYNNVELDLQDNIDIYELNSSIVKLYPTTLKTFNVRAVVLQTSYDGKLKQTRIVEKHTSDLVVNIEKTVQNLSVSIEANCEALKNASSTEDLTKLAFVTTSNKQYLFDVIFTVESSTEENLKYDVKNFISDFDAGKILLNIYPNDNLIKFEGTNKEEPYGTKWSYVVHAYIENEIVRDTEYRIYYSYTKANQNDLPIKNVTFSEDIGVTYSSDITTAMFELYDGKIFSLEFAHENSIDNPLNEVVHILSTSVISDDINLVAGLTRIYTYFEDDHYVTATDVKNADGSYQVVVKDKYGNIITSPKYYFEDPQIVYNKSGEGIKCEKVTASAFSSALNVAPVDYLYISVSDDANISSVRVNEGQVVNGSWSKSKYEDFTEVAQNLNEIVVTRYGYQGSEIQITGINGLLSVLYERDEKVFELANVLNYTIKTSLSAYSDVLTYDSVSGKLFVTKSLASDINLWITATSELGITYNINLTIKQNITIKLTRITEQLNLEKVNENNKLCLYSNNQVEYKLEVSFICKDGDDESGLMLYLSKGSFDKNSENKELYFSPEFGDKKGVVSKYIYVNFSLSELYEQTITISTLDGQKYNYAFKFDIEFVVVPNITIVNGSSINKSVLFDNLNNPKTILSIDELQTTSAITDKTLIKRIVGNEPINLEDLTLSFRKDNLKDTVFLNGSTLPLNKNIFSLIDNSISCTDTMTGGVYSENGEYYALLNVAFGDYVFGTIHLDIATSITPNYATDRFVLYNDKIYLALIGGETIKLAGSESSFDYIKNSFAIKEATADDTLELQLHISNDLAVEVGTDDNTYQLFYVNSYVFSNSNLKLTITHKVKNVTVAIIEFPVVIMPFNSDYVSYKEQPTFGNSSTTLNNISSLNSYQQLIKYNVFDTYLCGEQISLFQTDTQNYGFSKDILTKINDKNLNLSIRYADANGEITNVEYRNYIDKTGFLDLDTSIHDIVLYAVLSDTKNDNQLGLYRINLKADAKININYPYSSNESTDCAEYVTDCEINLNQKFGINYPNYNKKRIELNNKTTGVEIANYSVNYSIFTVNGQENPKTLFKTYGLQLDKENGTLLINTYSAEEKSYTLVLKAEILQHNLIVDTVYYTLQVNKQPQVNFVLLEGYLNYEKQTEIIPNGSYYDYSNIKLYTQNYGKTQTILATEELKYYYYLVDDPENTALYINKNEKQLSLNSNAVSDKVVNMVFYTIYCPVLTTTLTFESGYNYELRSNDILQEVDDHYEIFADLEFDFKEQFKITNAFGAEVNLNDVAIEYYLDGVALTPIDKKICFSQSQVGNHTLKIVAKLKEKSLASEDYSFAINLIVKESISSTHKTNLSALKLENIEYNTNYKYLNDTSEGWQFNNIFAVAPSTDAALFNVANINVLKDYSLRVVVADNCKDFVSVVDNEKLIQIISDVEDWTTYILPIYLNKSPNKNNLNVLITFTLVKNDQDVLSAKLKFTVEPDINVTLQYPQPNETSALKYEARYLGEEEGTITFADNTTYFGASSRVVFTNNKGIEITDYSRIALNVVTDGSVLINNGKEPIYSLPFESTISLNWYKTAVQNDLSGNVKFEITVDGVVHETYLMTFYNNINKIFSIDEITNLYQDKVENTSENPEIFFATSKDSEAIFSHNTALLTFKSTGKTANLTAYLNEKEIGTITLGSTIKTYNWLLIDTNGDETNSIKEDLSNIIIKDDNSNEYTFVKNATNSIYKTYMQSGSVSLTYRIALKYLNNKVDYQYYNALLDIGGKNIQSYTVDRNSAIENQNITISINGETLKVYYYSVVFDFSADYDITKSELTLSAGSSYESGNTAFGITTLNGEEFTEEYFASHGVYYFAQLVMITNVNFEQNQTMDNVIYASKDGIEILNKEFIYFNELKKQTAKYDYCVGIAKLQVADSENYYDFKLTAYGAENAGNYAYILVTYSTDANVGKGIINSDTIENNKLTYALLKVFVTPNNNTIRLLNTTGDINGEETENRQIISYNDNKKFEITNQKGEVVTELLMGKYGSLAKENDLIFVDDSKGFNAIVPSNVNTPYKTILTLKGDIEDYATLDIVSGDSATLRQKENTVAYYGDKEGYILIQDLYGYQKKYYLTLKAFSNDYKMSLANGEDEGETFVNYIASPNTFFDGTEMVVIGLETIEVLGERGAIRVKNFDKLQAETSWSYTLTYLLFEDDEETLLCPAVTGSSFVLPTIKDSSKNVNLRIVINITPSSGVPEIVTLSTYIKIQKRFVLKTIADSTSSVQSGVEFNLNKFFTVQDSANANVNLGDATISSNTLTLLVSKTQKNNSINLYAKHKEDATQNFEFSINVGLNFDGNDMNAITINSKEYYIYPLALNSKLKNINFNKFDFTILSNISDDQYVFVADKIVYLTTSKLQDGDLKTVHVNIQNSTKVFCVPFELNKNGTQAKSLVEIIANHKLVDINNKVVNDIDILDTNNVISAVDEAYSTLNLEKTLFEFNLSTTPVSADDLQLIKNFTIFDDNLVLKFKKGVVEDITSIDYSIIVKEKGKNIILGELNYDILQNIDHTRYISLYSILLDKLDLDKTYTITITVNCKDENTVVYYGNTLVDGTNYMFDFNCTKITDNLDTLSVDTVDAFKNSKIYQLKKSYIIKLTDLASSNSLLEHIDINYNVTPEYYAIDNYKNIVSATRTIYANQYTLDDKGNYKIEFNSWANQFNLINLAGETLKSLNNGSENLRFSVIKGVGFIDEHNALQTLSSYKPGDDFVIKVEVKVIGDDYVEIGQVQVKLNNEYVYVTNLATYMFTISHPNTTETIDATYTFTKNLVTLTELVLDNESLQGKISDGQIDVGGYKDISTCNIDVITVIQDIYSAEYYYDIATSSEYIKIKLKLNEITSTLGKTVDLQIQPKTSQGVYGQTIDFSCQVSADEYIFSNIDKQEKDATNVLTIYIPFDNSGIVGADYTYTAKVISTGNTNSGYLFAKRDSTVSLTDGQTALFTLSFKVGNNTHKTLLASYYNKTTSDLLKNADYFTINVTNLATIDGVVIAENNISYYSVKYVGAFNLDTVEVGTKFLFKAKSGVQTVYSIGLAKQNSEIFEISIAPNMFDKIQSSYAKIEVSKYSGDVVAKNYNSMTYNLPQNITLDLSETEGINQGVYGIYTNSIAKQKIFAIQATDETKKSVDISVYLNNLEGYDVVTFIDYTNNVNSKVVAGDSVWQIGSASDKYLKVSITENVNTYDFNDNSLKNITTTITRITTSTIDLADLVTNSGKVLTNNAYYNFTVTNPKGNNEYIALKAESGHIAINNISNFFDEDGVYVINYQNVDNGNYSLSVGTQYYKLYNGDDLVGIKCVQYNYVDNNYYSLTKNILEKNTTRAEIINGTDYITDISFDTDYCFTYFTITKNSTQHYYYVDYRTTSGTFEIALTTFDMGNGDILTITASTDGFNNFNGESFTLLVPVDTANDQNFKVNWGEEETDITVGKGVSSKEVTGLTGTVGNNLTINKE